MFNVWYRNFLIFKNTFFVSLIWITLEPVIFLGALGFGFSQYISNIQNLSYLEFFFSGLLCTTVMTVSYFESTYPNFAKLNHQKIYSTMLLTSITPKEIVLGEIFWCATKGLLGALGVILVSSFFGLFTYKVFLTLPILFLLSLIFASFGFFMTSLAKNYDTFIYSTSGIIMPLSLISGTYFSTSETSEALRNFTMLFPLTHGVDLVRNIIYFSVDEKSLLQLGVLVGYLFFTFKIAQYYFYKKILPK